MFPFFVHCSSFLYLPVRLAPSFVRSLFVHCSSFVRLLFVFCSFIVRLLFVLCSFFVRSLFVLCSSFLYLPVRFAPSFVRRSFVPLFRYYTPSPWERVGERIFSLFACRATTACAARTIYLLCYDLALLYLLPFTFYL